MQLSLNQIREDLGSVRYYYSRKENFNSSNPVLKAIAEKVKKYDDAVNNIGNARFSELYVSLYHYNNSQEVVAENMNVSSRYINTQHKELLLRLQKTLS